MNAKLNDILTKIKEVKNKMSPKVRKMLLVGIAVAVIFSIAAAVILNNKPYETLFTGLNDQESSEIIGKLQESQVPYKYENNGTILVPKDQVEKLKAQLVYEGYPKSGFTYNVFKDNISLTSSDFEKNSYSLYDLQERLRATVASFSGVKDAVVTIAPGEDRKYVLDNSNVTEASASVVVIMKDGGSPTKEQVEGIQRLVSKSIPQVTFENIVVLDGNGNDVSVASETSQSGANQVKLEFEQAMEDSIKAKVLNVLAPIYGANRVKVSVHCVADVDKKIREIINYESPNGVNTKGIPSSESADQEMVRNGEGEGGIPGTETNADIPNYTRIATDGTETYIRNQGDIDYLVNQLKEQAQVDSAILEDVTISVAIDGKDLGDLNRNDLIALIARAAGINQEVQNDKIAIVSTPFYQPSIVPDVITGGIQLTPRLLMIIGIAAGIALLLILILVLVLIRRKKKKKEKQKEENTAENALAALAQAEAATAMNEANANNLSAELLNIKNEHGLELKNKIRDFSQENPEIAAQLLKQWLRGGDNDGNE